MEVLQNNSGESITGFIEAAIIEHKSSLKYKQAEIGKDYSYGKNRTMIDYVKWLWTETGQKVPDLYSPNHKATKNFYGRIVIQEASYLAGNGIFFDDEKNKEKLGKDIDSKIYDLVKTGRSQGVAFGFFNKDYVKVFSLLEFVPLYDEDTSELKAGIYWWQVDPTKPIRAVLYELDGFTEYIKEEGEDWRIYAEKRAYIIEVVNSNIDGEIEERGYNYPAFPIVPFYANELGESTLPPLRQKIDSYDLIMNGLANNVDEASEIFWIIQNAGGMDEVDFAKFRDRVMRTKVASTDDETSVEAHTLEVPYQARETALSRLERDIIDDSMSLDVKTIQAGNVTATQIKASYEPLDEKADEIEMQLYKFFDRLNELADIDETPTFNRKKIINEEEQTNMILSAAQYLDEQTILEKLPFLSVDEVETILQRKDKEELDRYNDLESNAQQNNIDGEQNGENDGTESTEGTQNEEGATE